MKDFNRARRLAVEMLEARLVLDNVGLGAGMAAVAWEQVIVSLRDDAGRPWDVAPALVAEHGGALGHVYEHGLSGFSAQLPAPAVRALQNHPLVKFVEPDLTVETFGQTVPTGVSRINAAPGAAPVDVSWVNIAILDTGIQRDHPDLNVVGGQRFYTVTTGPPPRRGSFQDDQYDDDNGHGTHVAGTAAASGGIVGVAPGAPLWSVKVLDSSGSGYVSDIIAGVEWVTGTRNDGNPETDIHVANMSLGGIGWSDGLHTAIQKSVEAGVVYVVAAGNSARDIYGPDGIFGTSDDTFPASYPEVAAITAFVDTDGQPGGLGDPTSYGADDTFASFSNFANGWGDIAEEEQPVNSPGAGIDLVLPGVDILSTYLNGGYAIGSGTSMAAPHAAGMAARYIAEHGAATNAAGVAAIRQALIDAGKAWASPEGLFGAGPDGYRENVGWVGDPVVNLAPSVSITEPADGAQLQDVGVVTIAATVEAAEGTTVSQVEFFVGETSIGVGTFDSGTGVWSASWDTAATDNGDLLYPDGTYTITAEATAKVTNAQEEVTGSASITVVLDNVDEAPEVAITSPTAGATVSGEVVITAEATDDRGVTSVIFTVTGGEDYSVILPGTQEADSNVWSAAWDTSDLNDGATYRITAAATDTGGNTTTSADIEVTVDNTVATLTTDLTGEAVTVNRNFWRAYVTVTVFADGQPRPDATVEGVWGNGRTASGTTNSVGEVRFDSGNLRRNSVDSITFMVTDVAFGEYVYDPPEEEGIRIHQHGEAVPLSANLYHELAVWQAIEQNRAARSKQRTVDAEAVDHYLLLAYGT